MDLGKPHKTVAEEQPQCKMAQSHGLAPQLDLPWGQTQQMPVGRFNQYPPPQVNTSSVAQC